MRNCEFGDLNMVGVIFKSIMSYCEIALTPFSLSERGSLVTSSHYPRHVLFRPYLQCIRLLPVRASKLSKPQNIKITVMDTGHLSPVFCLALKGVRMESNWGLTLTCFQPCMVLTSARNLAHEKLSFNAGAGCLYREIFGVR